VKPDPKISRKALRKLSSGKFCRVSMRVSAAPRSMCH